MVWCSRAKDHCVRRWKFLVNVHFAPQMLYWTYLEEEIRYLRRREIGSGLGVVAAELRIIRCADGSPCRGAFCSVNALLDILRRRRIEEY